MDKQGRLSHYSFKSFKSFTIINSLPKPRGHYELLGLEIVEQASLPVDAARRQLRATLEPILVGQL